MVLNKLTMEGERRLEALMVYALRVPGVEVEAIAASKIGHQLLSEDNPFLFSRVKFLELSSRSN